MLPPDEHGLADRTIDSWHAGCLARRRAGNLGCTKSGASGRRLHAPPLCRCCGKRRKAGSARARGKISRKVSRTKCAMTWRLGHGAIHSRAHGSQVVPARCRVDGRASQLALGQAIPWRPASANMDLNSRCRSGGPDRASHSGYSRHHFTGAKLVGRTGSSNTWDDGRCEVIGEKHFKNLVIAYHSLATR